MTVQFLSDQDVVARILDHIANKTTDRGEAVWQEPVENYRSPERFEKELELFRAAYCGARPRRQSAWF